MQKVIPLGTATAREAAASTTSRVLRFPETPDRANRTFICTVVFVDLVEYSKKPVAEQLQVKERLNNHIAEAIRDIAASDRIILDTGDGVAINFLGDPEDALFVAMNLAQSFGESRAGEPNIEARIGINLGPVRLVRDINSQPNIIGDGINVAQRVMSFAQRGQVLLSRSYYEVVTRISEDYARLFAYQGSRTDKHVREHEIYEITTLNSEAHDLTLRRKHARPEKGPVDTLEPIQETPAAGVFSDRRLAFAATALSTLALAAALLFYFTSNRVLEPDAHVALAPAPLQAPTPVQPISPPAAQQPEPTTAPALSATEAPLQPEQTEPVAHASPRKAAAKEERASFTRRADDEAAAGVHAENTRAQEHRASPADAGAQAPEPAKPVLAPIPSAPPPIHTLKAPAGPSALVRLAISPWGEVFVDGRPVGISPPLAELEVPVGTHRIEVRNGGFKPYQEDVELGSNQTIRIKHKFTQGS